MANESLARSPVVTLRSSTGPGSSSDGSGNRTRQSSESLPLSGVHSRTTSSIPLVASHGRVGFGCRNTSHTHNQNVSGRRQKPAHKNPKRDTTPRMTAPLHAKRQGRQVGTTANLPHLHTIHDVLVGDSGGNDLGRSSVPHEKAAVVRAGDDEAVPSHATPTSTTDIHATRR